MLQLWLELLPFAVFVGVGIFAFKEPGMRGRAPAPVKTHKAQRFCDYAEGGRLLLADPDGTPVPRNR